MAGNPTQIFSRVFKQAYTNAGKLSLFARLTTDLIAQICLLIASELSVQDLALAKELTVAAVYFVQMYATDKLVSLHAHKHVYKPAREGWSQKRSAEDCRRRAP